ncbi:MAG: hypothetical protein QXW39_07025 [Candidatus Bathyarchaeia archaeon]
MRFGVMNAYVTFDGKKLKFYMFSNELPPLLAIGGTRAKALFSILSKVFGASRNNGIEEILVKPFYVLAVLTWIVASLSTAPSEELLKELIRTGVPKSTVELIFEQLDAKNGYRKNGPLISGRKLQSLSSILAKILKLHRYCTQG